MKTNKTRYISLSNFASKLPLLYLTSVVFGTPTAILSNILFHSVQFLTSKLTQSGQEVTIHNCGMHLWSCIALISVYFLEHILLYKPVPVAAPSNAWVIIRSLAGVAGLNLADGGWMSLSDECL